MISRSAGRGGGILLPSTEEARRMTPNPIRRRWQAGQPALGTFVFSTDPANVEIAGRAGFDFVTVDLEHAPLGIEHAAGHIRAAAAAGIAALVRVPNNDIGLMSKLLDLGAHGLMLPHFGKGAAETRAFAELLRYAPAGDRPSCTGVRAASYGVGSYADYVKHVNADVLGIGLVEDVEVIARLDALLKEVKIDAVMPGPGDLSTSMGLHGQPTHPQVKQAVADVIASARRAGLRAGMYLNSPAEIEDWRPLKLDFYVYLIDTKVLALAYAAAIAGMRK
jgi:2-keto-3-deoxy-L-rhamnonate aldolase RhmA